MNAYDWCHVTFTKDKATVNLRTSYIKDVVEGLIAPQDLKIGELYKVFWSADPEDSPQKIIDAGNDIIDLTVMSEKDYNRAKKAGPLKGYFEAMLLDLQKSEDSFCDLDKVSTSASARVKIPSAKVLEAKAKPLGSKGRKSSDSKKHEQLAAQAASSANLISLIRKCQPAEQLKKRKSEEPESSEDSETSSESEEEMEVSESESTNTAEYWKKKFFEREKTISKNKNRKQKSKKKKNTKFSLSCHKLDNLLAQNVPHRKITYEENQNKPREDEDDVFQKSAIEILEEEVKATGGDQSESPRTSTKVAIHKQKIKDGEAGDSLFCFNEAAKLWDPKVLAIRSVTGLSSSKSREPQLRGYPKMTPTKYDKVKEALAKRAKSEGAGQVEIDRRVKKVNTHLAQKISTVRRSLRQKNVIIPSATAVWEVRERDPNADGLSAYVTNDKSTEPVSAAKSP